MIQQQYERIATVKEMEPGHPESNDPDQAMHKLYNFSQSLEEMPPVLAEAIQKEVKKALDPLLEEVRTATENLREANRHYDASAEAYRSAAAGRQQIQEEQPGRFRRPQVRERAITRNLEETGSIPTPQRELQPGTIIPFWETPPPARPGFEWKSTLKGRELREKK